MRAIYILSILLIVTLNGCATVEIAKEVTKAGDRIKTTIQKAAKNQNDLEKTEDVIKTQDITKNDATSHEKIRKNHQ